MGEQIVLGVYGLNKFSQVFMGSQIAINLR